MSQVGILTRALKWKTLATQSISDAKNIEKNEGIQKDIKFYDDYSKGNEEVIGSLIIKHQSIARSKNKADIDEKLRIKQILSKPYVKEKK